MQTHIGASSAERASSSGAERARGAAPLRIAVVSTHVIQHLASLYRGLTAAGGVDLHVIYGCRTGVDPAIDPGFGREVAWDTDLTSGYSHEFLARESPPVDGRFLSVRGDGIEAALSRFRPDVVHVYGHTPMIMLRALAWARVRGVPVSAMCDSEGPGSRPAWKRALKAAVLPPLFRQYAGFVTIGDNNEAYLERYGVARSAFVRGGIPTDEPLFKAAREQRAALRTERRAEWGFDDDVFVALFVGKLVERKRPLDLIRAVDVAARATGRRIAAVFAGDGVLRPELEREAGAMKHGTAKLLGFINQRALPGVFAAADIVVHPASRDPHPLTITDATIVGLPVVVSDHVGCIGPTDTARPGVNALVYPTGDVGALALQIQRLATDSSAFAGLARGAALVARENGVDACVGGFLTLAKRLAAQ